MVLKSDDVEENTARYNNIPDIKGIMSDSSVEFDDCDSESWGEQTEEESQEYLKEVFKTLTAEGGREKLSLQSFLTWEGKFTKLLYA